MQGRSQLAASHTWLVNLGPAFSASLDFDQLPCLGYLKFSPTVTRESQLWASYGRSACPGALRHVHAHAHGVRAVVGAFESWSWRWQCLRSGPWSTWPRAVCRQAAGDPAVRILLCHGRDREAARSSTRPKFGPWQCMFQSDALVWFPPTPHCF